MNTGQNPQRNPIVERTIRVQTIEIERKKFTFQLRENPRGRLIRITEESAGKFNVVIVPAPGIAQFVEALQRVTYP